MSKNIRLDLYLYQNNMADSRERAKALIKAGLVYINDKQALKSSQNVAKTDQVSLKGELEFVSRGGYKLKKAIEVFGIDLNNKICLDVGASTGGFTDCMLQNGADKVYALDVGSDQLAPKLKEDKRVINIENTNIRNINSDLFEDKIDFASIDVSFISLELVLPIVYNLLVANGRLVGLIKPQFEVGRDDIGKKGIVNKKSAHKRVLERLVNLSLDLGFRSLDLSFSPIKGQKGNIEYLLYAKKSNVPEKPQNIDLLGIIDLAHKDLQKI